MIPFPSWTIVVCVQSYLLVWDEPAGWDCERLPRRNLNLRHCPFRLHLNPRGEPNYVLPRNPHGIQLDVGRTIHLLDVNVGVKLELNLRRVLPCGESSQIVEYLVRAI